MAAEYSLQSEKQCPVRASHLSKLVLRQIRLLLRLTLHCCAHVAAQNRRLLSFYSGGREYEARSGALPPQMMWAWLYRPMGRLLINLASGA
jgi:hypothetical protein